MSKPIVRFTVEVTAPCGCVLSTGIDHDYESKITPGNIRAAADGATQNLTTWATQALMRHQCDLKSDDNPNGLQELKGGRSAGR